MQATLSMTHGTPVGELLGLGSDYAGERADGDPHDEVAVTKIQDRRDTSVLRHT
jgi:hypothetical protein